jgi:hypothetical protein
MGRTLAAGAIGLVLAGGALGASARDTYTLTANLRARFEVPKPKGVPAGAEGLFTGKAVELSGNKARITWRLTFKKTSGRVLSAHIHIGKAGKAGGVMAPLCGPCRSGQRGTATVTHARLRTIRAGGAYVNLHTARNPAGEIRGQLKAVKSASSSGGDEPPPSPEPEPPPYPPYEP